MHNTKMAYLITFSHVLEISSSKKLKIDTFCTWLTSCPIANGLDGR